MKRREFIAGLGAASACPLTSFAQQKPPPVVIGFLGGQAQPTPGDAQGKALRQGFFDNGLVEGRDYVMEERFVGSDNERFQEFARELARLKVRMILANTPAGVRAVQRLDQPGPVLMTIMNDPVGAGLVASLPHPGTHTTGTSGLTEDLPPKRLWVVRE